MNLYNTLTNSELKNGNRYINRWSRVGYLAIQGKIVGYDGEKDEYGWAHGKGRATFEDGSTYE